jgi:hypothetical protein
MNLQNGQYDIPKILKYVLVTSGAITLASMAFVSSKPTPKQEATGNKIHLKAEMSARNVQIVQNYLNEYHKTNLPTNGTYDKATEEEVIKRFKTFKNAFIASVIALTPKLMHEGMSFTEALTHITTANILTSPTPTQVAGLGLLFA